MAKATVQPPDQGRGWLPGRQGRGHRHGGGHGEYGRWETPQRFFALAEEGASLPVRDARLAQQAGQLGGGPDLEGQAAVGSAEGLLREVHRAGHVAADVGEHLEAGVPRRQGGETGTGLGRSGGEGPGDRRVAEGDGGGDGGGGSGRDREQQAPGGAGGLREY